MFSGKVCLVFFTLTIPFLFHVQGQTGYSITSSIGGLTEGEKVLMYLIDFNIDGSEKLVRADSVYVINGKFMLTGIVPEGPRFYILTFGDEIRIGVPKIRLFINNGQKIKISIPDITKISRGFIEEAISIEGSPTQDSRRFVVPVFTVYDQSMARVNRLARQLKDSIGFSGEALNGIYAARHELNEAIFYNLYYNVDTFLSDANLTLCREIYDRTKHGSILPAIYQMLDSTTRKSYYGKLLKNFVPLCVGEPIPEFTLPDVSGKSVSLKSVYAKSKLTVLHIWAANSFERSKRQLELTTFYKKYHTKGLNIIGLSSDNDEKVWKTAVKKTNAIPWPNVSDLKGKDGIVNTVYQEYGDQNPFIHNTTNILVDSNGKIVAWDVDGVEFEWLLWKHLEQTNN